MSRISRPVLNFVSAIALALAASVPVHASGILAPSDQTLPPLRVTDHLVDAKVHDGVAVTTVTQTFHNDTSRRLEATYVFPLPETADLTDFQMSFNGKMVKGRVLPRDEARTIYESIVRQSQDPGLIEFIGHRLLQMRVFPIEPQSDTTVQVRYQQICRPVSGMTAYHYPLRTAKTDGRAHGTVRFRVGLHSSAPLKGVWSPSHSVEVVRRGEHDADVAYETRGGSLEDDFLLLYHTDSSDLGLSVVAHRVESDEPGHFVLMLTPRQLWPDQNRQPQDVVFVMDTSGSMAGDKITQVRSALKYCIDQLDAKDRFGIVRFSTGFDTLFDPLVPATSDNRAQARRWVDSFEAAGGTNIADAIDETLSLRSGDSERPFVVVFLTDGQGNRSPDEILARVTKHENEGVRIFPFGVGHNVNTILLDRLADAAHGRPTYVQPGEDLELVLGDFFAIVSQPVLTRLKLTLPGIDATERFPAKLGDLYHGQQVILAGRFDTELAGPVTLTAMREGQRVAYTWENVAFTSTPEAAYVPSVWAGRKIAYLLDQIRTHGQNQEMINEVLALSQQFGIQTPYSSWLVDPERQPVLLGAAPGAGGGAFREAGHRRELQLRLLEGLPAARNAAPAATPMSLDEFSGGVTLEDAEQAMDQAAGKASTVIAAYTATLRERASGDLGRIDTRALPRVRIDGRWYNRVAGYLVDDRIDAKTQVTTIRFGSDAYFELAGNRADLRAVLARDRHVFVLVTEGRAVLVADTEGIETLTEELRQQLDIQAP